MMVMAASSQFRNEFLRPIEVRRIDTKTVRLLSKAALLAGAPQRAELRARDAQAVSCKRADLEEEARAFMALALAQHASGNTDSAMFSVTEVQKTPPKQSHFATPIPTKRDRPAQ
eukprot:4898701-Amphidinium_carterae.1